ncbi:mannosyl-oligosaccharide 1,2-alpha-mannosidase IA isoform X6 [Apis mellifera caucasica]|nr:mannosyl-oligosaccharide 1,2-alpha-mannosidase IA isoform X6 [Apis mellifera caucasica]KAG9432372.1 mannosyl-oligosaccharide 1,2-alpha-mannosidase IA isoform X6 [Apis mellifera carnica]
MRLMQRLAISGLLSVILIVLLTGTFVTRRDLANVVERGGAPEERSSEQQANPAWVQSNAIPGQDEAKPLEDKDRWVDPRQRQSEPSAVGPPPVPVPGPYVIKPPNPPLDDVTNQRREKIKEWWSLIRGDVSHGNFAVFVCFFLEMGIDEEEELTERWDC